MESQSNFLMNAANAARAAGHIWPAHSACETALESAWGTSRLAVLGRNLFGQKQGRQPIAGTTTLTLPTREFLHGVWVEQTAEWVVFPNLAACFRARMAMLRSEAAEYPNYAAALKATSGEEFVREVSKTWSTDPARADKVMAIYHAHASVFTPVTSIGLPEPVKEKGAA